MPSTSPDSRFLAIPATPAAAGAPERPRDRLLRCGPAGLRDDELIALLFGRRSSRVAERVATGVFLERVGGLSGLLARTPAEVAAASGLGEGGAARLVACAELGRRALGERLARGRPFRSSRDIFRHYGPRMRDLRVEQFRAVMLDGKHRILREELVSQGTLTTSPVHPREVFGPAMRHAAAALVLVHNHPSGDPTPSADDLEVTRRLADVGDLVGISVLDHVIVGDGAYASLADRGLLG